MLSEHPWHSLQVFSSQSLGLALWRSEWMLPWLTPRTWRGFTLTDSQSFYYIWVYYILPPIILP